MVVEEGWKGDSGGDMQQSMCMVAMNKVLWSLHAGEMCCVLLARMKLCCQ